MTHMKHLAVFSQKPLFIKSQLSKDCGISQDRGKISAAPLKSSVTLRKSFNPFRPHSHLINGETEGRSALFLQRVQVHREIPEIRDVTAPRKLEGTLHTYKAWAGFGPRSHSWFMAGQELRPRCRNSQAKQTELLFPSARRSPEPSSWHGRLLSTGTPHG